MQQSKFSYVDFTTVLCHLKTYNKYDVSHCYWKCNLKCENEIKSYFKKFKLCSKVDKHSNLARKVGKEENSLIAL
jgi:hypothetical protein